MPRSGEGSGIKLAWLCSRGLSDVSSPYGWVKNEVYLPKTARRHLLLHLPHTSPLCSRLSPRSQSHLIRTPLNLAGLDARRTLEDACLIHCLCNLRSLMSGLHAGALGEHVTADHPKQYYSTRP